MIVRDRRGFVRGVATPGMQQVRRNAPLNDFIEGLLRLDSTERAEDIVEFIQQSRPDEATMLYAINVLLASARFRAPYILAMIVAKAGTQHPMVALALATGGMIFGNTDEEARGLGSLRHLVDHLSAEQRTILYEKVMSPMLTGLLELYMRKSNAHVLQILEILKAGVPPFRSIFDLDTPPPVLSLDALRRQGRERAAGKLIHYPSPPPGAPRVPRRAVVAIRDLVYPGQSWSRPFDVGPRWAAGMEAYGWPTTFIGLACQNLIEDYRAIAEVCRRENAEVLVLDDHLIEAAYALPARSDMIAAFRRDLPALKLVGIHFDSWALDGDELAKASLMLDAIIDVTSPSLPAWKIPALSRRVLHIQSPHCGDYRRMDLPLKPRMLFAGGVKGYNWHRAFWLAAAEAYHLPIDQKRSTHALDGLSALDSYAVYMREQAEATCCLSPSMRSDLARIVTGRSFETIVAGSLLVQEETPEMDYHFISGEHYLSFTTFSELRAIARFIAEHADEAEDVRRRGAEFAHQRYSDEMLVGYIDKLLFFPDQ